MIVKNVKKNSRILKTVGIYLISKLVRSTIAGNVHVCKVRQGRNNDYNVFFHC